MSIIQSYWKFIVLGLIVGLIFIVALDIVAGNYGDPPLDNQLVENLYENSEVSQDSNLPSNGEESEEQESALQSDEPNQPIRLIEQDLLAEALIGVFDTVNFFERDGLYLVSFELPEIEEFNLLWNVAMVCRDGLNYGLKDSWTGANAVGRIAWYAFDETFWTLDEVGYFRITLSLTDAAIGSSSWNINMSRELRVNPNDPQNATIISSGFVEDSTYDASHAFTDVSSEAWFNEIGVYGDM
ncbi:MAG: hypothetical protein FWE24_07930 [Defluviitaleaceae bacterium]|nr:hypothetical protein [Defluviitaleaceae bacterium]